MSSTTTSPAELDFWSDKEPSGPVELSSEPASFFELNFNYDQDILDSSDASGDFCFFDEVELGSSSTDASSTPEGPSIDIYSARPTTREPIVQRLAQFAPAPVPVPDIIPQALTSQRLTHRLRPEGTAISSADLLSIEGRKHAQSATTIQPPKTPPTTPQHRGAAYSSKTLRTPRERGSRISKPAVGGSMRGSPKKNMQPSNYYHEDQQSFWNERFSLPQSELPLSPPPSVKVRQVANQGAAITPKHFSRPFLQSPTPTPALPTRRAHTSTMSMPQTQLRRGSIGRDGAQMSPLNLWADETPDLCYSPTSPLLADNPWDGSNGVAHYQNAHFEPVISTSSSSAPVSQSLAAGGLFIDFGGDDTHQTLSHSLSSPFSEDYDMQQPATSFLNSLSSLGTSTGNHQSGQQGNNFSFRTSRSPTPCPLPPASRHTIHTPKPQRPHIPNFSPRDHSADPPVPTSTSQHRHSRSTSSGAGICKPGTRSKASARTGGNQNRVAVAAGAGDMFVNFTPSDSRRILTGVAPSGSSKTKARREKEAREERRRMSEAAKRAVQEAGGDWDGLVGGLVEV